MFLFKYLIIFLLFIPSLFALNQVNTKAVLLEEVFDTPFVCSTTMCYNKDIATIYSSSVNNKTDKIIFDKISFTFNNNFNLNFNKNKIENDIFLECQLKQNISKDKHIQFNEETCSTNLYEQAKQKSFLKLLSYSDKIEFNNIHIIENNVSSLIKYILIEKKGDFSKFTQDNFKNISPSDLNFDIKISLQEIQYSNLEKILDTIDTLLPSTNSIPENPYTSTLNDNLRNMYKVLFENFFKNGNKVSENILFNIKSKIINNNLHVSLNFNSIDKNIGSSNSSANFIVKDIKQLFSYMKSKSDLNFFEFLQFLATKIIFKDFNFNLDLSSIYNIHSKLLQRNAYYFSLYSKNKEILLQHGTDLKKEINSNFSLNLFKYNILNFLEIGGNYKMYNKNSDDLSLLISKFLFNGQEIDKVIEVELNYLKK